MTEKSSVTAGADRLARRKLLKIGALAAPLVMTFRSSSAWALSGGCKLVDGTKPIPGTFVVPVPPYTSSPVVINNSVGDIVTSSTSLTSDEARFLIDNGNMSLSCYASITMGAGTVGFQTPTGSTSSTTSGSTSSTSSSGASSGNASSGGNNGSSTSSSTSSTSSSSGGRPH